MVGIGDHLILIQGVLKVRKGTRITIFGQTYGTPLYILFQLMQKDFVDRIILHTDLGENTAKRSALLVFRCFVIGRKNRLERFLAKRYQRLKKPVMEDGKEVALLHPQYHGLYRFRGVHFPQQIYRMNGRPSLSRGILHL